jgi:hypothetical protein
MSDPVKYPEQPPYRVSVPQQEEALLVDQPPRHDCAKCFMATLSLIFIILGIATTALASYTLVVLTFGGQNLLSGYSLGTVYTLLVVGLALIVISIIVWVSSCKPTAVCSKIILIIFAIVMIVVFIVQVCVLVLGLMWVGIINVNITSITGGVSVDDMFNDTVHELQELCCTNTSLADVCDHIINDPQQEAADCADFGLFYTLVVGFLTPLLKWVAAFLGVVAFLNLVAFFCSCCLLCARKTAVYKKNAYFNPQTTTYSSA